MCNACKCKGPDHLVIQHNATPHHHCAKADWIWSRVHPNMILCLQVCTGVVCSRKVYVYNAGLCAGTVHEHGSQRRAMRPVLCSAGKQYYICTIYAIYTIYAVPVNKDSYR